ncbi:hypothetical protein QFZ77_005404 [Paenibacillus sp. V4I3]|uniref:helix-turn-helix domain-containing protein n=1 Tax=Paenibacillus sp. V4I3 TaxID=3042305 RepID=UPI00277FC139|nr:helix-turn-helix domain-containing protein [Paenibacillus sp. V4I3]MDQ0876745.1 hypothetical protein [Paenibacillus sp. V4I3]
MNPLEHIMGTEEAAELWGIKQGHVKNLCRDGKVLAIQIGKTWILDKNQPNPSQPNHPKNWRGRKENNN